MVYWKSRPWGGGGVNQTSQQRVWVCSNCWRLCTVMYWLLFFLEGIFCHMTLGLVLISCVGRYVSTLSLSLFLLRSTVKVCVVPFVRAAWWSQSEPLSPSLWASAAGPVSITVLMKKSISCYQFHSAFTSSPPPPVFISEELVISSHQ